MQLAGAQAHRARLRRAAEDEVGAAQRAGRAADREADTERGVASNGQDFLRHRGDVEEAAERRPFEEGELEREVVHARVEARALAIERVEVERLVVEERRVAVRVDAGRVHRAIGLRTVGLLRQPERIIQEPLGAGERAADDAERAADRVDAVLEGRENERVAAVDHLVVDRHDGRGLRHVPVCRGEEHLRRDHGRPGARRPDLHACHQILGLRRVGVADRQHAASHRYVVERGVDARGELGRDRRERVAELRRVARHDGERRAARRDVLQLQRPGLARRHVAGEGHLHGLERAGGLRDLAARDFCGGRALGLRPDLAGLRDAERELSVEGVAGGLRGHQDLRRLAADRRGRSGADLERRAEHRARARIEHQH